MSENTVGSGDQLDESTETNWEIDVIRIGLGTAGVFTLIAAFTLVTESIETVMAGLETTLGSDYLLVASLGTVSLVFAALAFASGTTSPRQATMPEVERPTSVPVPGEKFDRCLNGRRGWLPIIGSAVRNDVRQQLRQTTIQMIAVEDGCGHEEAEYRVDEQTWTDDPRAAAFLDPESKRPRLTDRLAAFRRGETWLEYQASHTVKVLVDHFDDSKHR